MSHLFVICGGESVRHMSLNCSASVEIHLAGKVLIIEFLWVLVSPFSSVISLKFAVTIQICRHLILFLCKWTWAVPETCLEWQDWSSGSLKTIVLLVSSVSSGYVSVFWVNTQAFRVSLFPFLLPAESGDRNTLAHQYCILTELHSIRGGTCCPLALSGLQWGVSAAGHVRLLLCPCWSQYACWTDVCSQHWRCTVVPSHWLSHSHGSQIVQFSSVQSLSRDRLFVTPRTTARQASLSITNSRSLPKPMSIESVMPSNHLILCHPLFLLPSIFPSIRVFSNESALHIRWPKYWSFSFNISPSNEHPGLISFRMDWLDLLAVQGTLTSLLQHNEAF